MNSIDHTKIFAGKRVFLTGHTGFKGSWLLTWLHQLGAVVKGYALAPETPDDLYLAIMGDTMCESVIADIRDAARLKREVLSFQPDFIFHLAAQPLVRLSYQIPLETFEINAMGSAHLLEAMRYLEKKCVAVMITTDKVYHNREENYYYREDDKLGGYDPYSASKAAAEIIIDSYRKSFFNKDVYDKHGKSISVARAGNVIGGGDWAKDRIIPDIIKALSKGQNVIVRNPLAVRPWQHVLDPLNGYLTLASLQTQDPVRFAEAYNFGPFHEDNLTVEQVVSKAIEVWGNGYFEKPVNSDYLHEAGLLQLNISKALDQVKWTPRWPASKAIEMTINWYKAVRQDGENPKVVMEQQLHDFKSEK